MVLVTALVCFPGGAVGSRLRMCMPSHLRVSVVRAQHQQANSVASSVKLSAFSRRHPRPLLFGVKPDLLVAQGQQHQAPPCKHENNLGPKVHSSSMCRS